MEYNFKTIEKKWQQYWQDHKIYDVVIDNSKPKCYILDMFPYPSGAGLHVGHPLGYIASDIYARYKKLKGFNVLHPMGYDAFGLPAEQYALERNIHPAVSTEQNIANFRKQLDKIGFCYPWNNSFRTCDDSYYKWTQWIFLQLFNSWFNVHNKKAEKIESLVDIFTKKGSEGLHRSQKTGQVFSADDWRKFTFAQQQQILMNYRLMYSSEGEVNWCEALGTVLANDEVVNGLSERGGHPVTRKKLKQWYLRITAYADRLLNDLESLEWSDSMKDMQRNWIGKSRGADINFEILNHPEEKITVYTTRPETIFGVDFIVLSPEHRLSNKITTLEYKKAVTSYQEDISRQSERERMADKTVTGCFTGAFAIHPFTKKNIPIYIASYVLANYGTGSVMAVPCGDERDFNFATKFGIPITNILGKDFDGTNANPTKEAILSNSGMLSNKPMNIALEIILQEIEKLNIGHSKENFKIRDAAFSRQRYWGEPIPIIWKDDVAYPLSEDELPLVLPKLDTIKPGKDGKSPLSNDEQWNKPTTINYKGTPITGYRETNTMPGFAGSSWYFLRYIDPHNNQAFCSKEALNYWQSVDVYLGGTEHAVGHLLYSRMWTKVLYDMGYIPFQEPFKKMINQGMIQGSSRFVYRVNITCYYSDKKSDNIKEGGEFNSGDKGLFISYYQMEALKQKKINSIEIQNVAKKLLSLLGTNINEGTIMYVENISFIPIYVDVNMVDGLALDVPVFKEGFLKNTKGQDADIDFILEPDGQYICGQEVEKMSKSKLNAVSPDFLVDKYGADTFRMYEMFLGPIEQSKPWDTKGIEGVHRFLKKLWRLFFHEQKGAIWTNDTPTEKEYKILHRTIKKIQEDTERFSMNTAVSNFMIAVNELTEVNCSKKEILQPLLVVLYPYAPHITEEIWNLLGHKSCISKSGYPNYDDEYLMETTKLYPIGINGKVKVSLNISLNSSQQEIEDIVLQNPIIVKNLNGIKPKKIIYIQGKMINLVL
ncbi:MAG: class I tRNA ligase family protein [Phycisphaerales bacterium]|nr:class I tRNA ligase family protein [Phycisphaerales bacterium]